MLKNCIKNNLGFTLLELLVVVLIIGILAGIALPQYKKAVTKSKYATLKGITKSFYQAQQVYYMANGVYADSFDKLDVSINSDTDPIWINSYTMCTFNSSQYYLYCKDSKIQLAYLITYKDNNGKSYCVPYDNKLSPKICAEETGNEPSNTTGWYPY